VGYFYYSPNLNWAAVGKAELVYVTVLEFGKLGMVDWAHHDVTKWYYVDFCFEGKTLKTYVNMVLI